MKKSLAFYLIFFLCSTVCYTQNINITLNNSDAIGVLTSEMLEDCRPVIKDKLNQFCEAIEYIGSYDSNISPAKKRHRRDAIIPLFFRFDERFMTITSRSYPNGRKKKLRAYLNNLLIQSFGENQPKYKIENADFTITSDNKKLVDPRAWHLVNRYEDGTALYEASIIYTQEYLVKSRTIHIENPETHEPPQTHEIKDVDKKYIRVYLVLSPATEGGGYNALIRLGDIYASYLENR